MKYSKLVRDRMPEIIRERGQLPITHIATEEEFLHGEDEEELADILEVIHTICEVKKIDVKNLEAARKKKAEGRGGFKEKIILDEIRSSP